MVKCVSEYVFSIHYRLPQPKEQGSRVLSSSSKVLAFSREVQIPWQRRETAGESSPFNRTTFNGQIIMLPSYGQSTTAIYSDLIEQGLPRLDSQGLAFVKLRSPDLPSYFLLYRDTYSFRICKRGNQHRQKQEKHAQIVP